MSQGNKEKNESSIVRLGLVLFAITFAVALLLGVTNALTKDRIAASKVQATADAMKLVQPTADSFAAVDAKFENAIVEAVFEAEKGNEVVGWCVKVNPQGFSDIVPIMVGIGKDNAITGVSIISISDTPGLGAKATEPSFYNQYTGKKGPLTVVKGAVSGDNDILALTGATITSKGVTSGIQAALDCVANLQKEGILK